MLDIDQFVMKNHGNLRETSRTLRKRETVVTLSRNNPALTPLEIAKKTYNGRLDCLDHEGDINYEGVAVGIAHARPFYMYLKQVEEWLKEANQNERE